MSNYLAIATVTAAFGERIAAALHAVPGLSAAPELRVGRPPAEAGWVGANLFLYRVTPSAARRNDDLTTRDGKGGLLRRPAAALDLDYIVSFYGNDMALEPQRLMGSVVSTLHAFPDLAAEQIRRTIDAAGTDSFLAGSDLDQQTEPVRFTLTALDPDSLYRIWSLFTQVPYAPSVAYSGATVLLSPDLVPVRSLPSQAPSFAAAPAMPPVIDSVDPPAIAFGAGAMLTLRLRNIGDGAVAHFGDIVVPLAHQGRDYTVAVPPGLRAGVNSLQVATGTPAASLLSAAVSFLLLPRLADGSVCRLVADAKTGAPVAVIACNIAPTPRYDQAASLSLTPVPPAAADGPRPAGSASPLRLVIDAGHAADLDRAALTPALRALLTAKGAAAGDRATVTVTAAGRLWRLTDAASGQACRLEKDGGQIVVHYALPADDPNATLAFLAGGVSPGRYLIAVQIGERPPCASPLRRGTALGAPIAVPTRPLDDATLPDALRAAFAAAGAAPSDQLSIGRPMPGDGWQIDDRATGRRYWVSQEPTGLHCYLLDGPGAAFFGPVVTVPGASP